MKTFTVFLTGAFLALCASIAFAQTVSTSFTLGAPYNNYLPALTQDGVATSGDWWIDYVYDCALTTPVCGGQPQGTVGISLPNDPSVSGERLNLSCTGTIQVDTRPVWTVWPNYGPAPPQPAPGILQSAEACTDNATGASFTGTLTYQYVAVQKRVCSSGRGGYCRTAWVPVIVGGFGTFGQN